MKTKLLFYAIQKLKNAVKLNPIFTFLIIFLMTVTSFSQSDGISFDCDDNTVSFGAPSEIGFYNGQPYWDNGTIGASTGWTLYVEIDPQDGPIWAVRAPGINSPVPLPNNDYIPGLLYYTSEFNGSPSCKGSDWTPVLVGLPCTSIIVSCTMTGGPIEVCPTYYADADGDGFGNPDNIKFSCDGIPAGYVTDNTDCFDDGVDAETAYPGAEEIPFDMIDNDCDGEIDENDNPPVVLDYCDDQN